MLLEYKNGRKEGKTVFPLRISYQGLKSLASCIWTETIRYDGILNIGTRGTPWHGLVNLNVQKWSYPNESNYNAFTLFFSFKRIPRICTDFSFLLIVVLVILFLSGVSVFSVSINVPPQHDAEETDWPHVRRSLFSSWLSAPGNARQDENVRQETFRRTFGIRREPSVTILPRRTGRVRGGSDFKGVTNSLAL